MGNERMKTQSSWPVLGTLFLSAVFIALIQFDSQREQQSTGRNNDIEEHARERRFLYMSSDRRLALPPKTLISFEASLTLPALRDLPVGYEAILTLETLFSIRFDNLGLTSEEYPWFLIPLSYLMDISNVEVNKAGGDRLTMYEFVEDLLDTIGMPGKPCLLRAICEIFEVPLKNHGFIGEILQLFLRPISEEESREKRFVYITRERRLTLPPGTILIIAPILTIPFKGSTPDGRYRPRFQISVPFQVYFDDLGLTVEEHPWGVIEGLHEIFRRRRNTADRQTAPEEIPGGDRALFYSVVEETLHRTTGLNGKACLLRAICEMFQYPLEHHGFFGEILELFFSASQSLEADKRLPEYTAAEKSGKTTGNCSAYFRECLHSLFKSDGDQQTS